MINHYLENDQLNLSVLGRGFAWLDTGTHDSLIDASQFVQTVEKRQGLKVACLEEIAYASGWIAQEVLFDRAEELGKSSYGEYIRRLAVHDIKD